MTSIITESLVEMEVTGPNNFSSPIENLGGFFNYSLRGTWVGTITLQRSFDSGSTWEDVDTHTSNVSTYGYEPGKAVQYRYGFKTGEWTSGIATGRLENGK